MNERAKKFCLQTELNAYVWTRRTKTAKKNKHVRTIVRVIKPFVIPQDVSNNLLQQFLSELMLGRFN